MIFFRAIKPLLPYATAITAVSSTIKSVKNERNYVTDMKQKGYEKIQTGTVTTQERVPLTGIFYSLNRPQYAWKKDDTVVPYDYTPQAKR